MRKMSLQRRRVVLLASSLTCMGGVGPSLSQHHPQLEDLWLGLMATLLIWVIVQMMRLRKDEGCVKSSMEAEDSSRSKP